MIPRRVVLENFLSFGTPAAVVEFTDDEPLWVLCGPNGVGKSAVFDAITYALFGCHRGGKGKGMDDLIRHGTNGFRVEFEFGVGPREYRITRSRGKKSVERLFRKAGDAWEELDVGRDGIKAWAERELGLTFEQFTASVLLRQGEADAIITATGANRLAMLKKVIGVERYEALSERVKKAATAADNRKKVATAAAADVPAVTPDEFAAATNAQDDATAAHAAAVGAEAAAAGRVALAKDHAQHARREAELTALLDAAAARRATADRIRTDHARLTDLDAALPTLAKLVPARDARARLIPERDRAVETVAAARARLDEAGAAREAGLTAAEDHRGRAAGAAAEVGRLKPALATDRELIGVAREVEAADRKLLAYPPTLDAEARAAAALVAEVEPTAAAAGEVRAASKARLDDLERQSAAFGDVAADVPCSRCGQRVTAEHAAAERQRLAVAVAAGRAELAGARAAEVTAADRLKVAKAESAKLAGVVRERDDLRVKRAALFGRGVVPALDIVTARVDAATAELTAREEEVRVETGKAERAAADGKAADARRRSAESDLRTAADAQARVDRDFLAADATVSAQAGTLAGDWSRRWEALTAADLAGYAAERERLRGSGVEAEFRALGEDAALDADRAKQREAARAAIAAIPEAARGPVADAETDAKAARAAAEAARDTRDAATRALVSLHARQAKRADLVAAEKAAEADARAHATLDRLLGADGLQRELVRAAERQIVRYADETVRHLSDGDLSVALDDADDGPDKAFTLKVLRADDPTPIGVHYLSGSQKFRVAVAVALGIGRFATAGTQARPLESVVIDEGFGSLDPDGLRCMADELHRLKDRLALKRVVLVSHQEEFVARFPVGYRLAPGAAGTTAEPFRR